MGEPVCVYGPRAAGCALARGWAVRWVAIPWQRIRKLRPSGDGTATGEMGYGNIMILGDIWDKAWLKLMRKE